MTSGERSEEPTSHVAAYRRAQIDNAIDHGTQAVLTFEREWPEVAWDALVELARSGREFTADDLVWKVGQPDSANAVGAVFRTATRSGLIVSTGVARSTRIQRRGGLHRIWRGAT